MPSRTVRSTHKDEEGREEQREVILLQLAQLDPAAGLQALEDREGFKEHWQDVVERDHGEGRQRRLHKGPKARAMGIGPTAESVPLLVQDKKPGR